MNPKCDLGGFREALLFMASYFVRKGDLEKIKSIRFCVYCGFNLNLVIDHIIPRNKGGSNDISNLTSACNKCNLYKSDFTIIQFLKRIEDKRIKTGQVISSCIYIISKHRQRGTQITCKYQNVYTTLKNEREKHSYYSSIIGNIIREKYKLF
jgi:hypothetical protein